jgi:hypothetical protein
VGSKHRYRLMAMIEPLIADIREQGDEFDSKRLDVKVSKQQEHKLWLSQATTFLKHADRDPNDFLAMDDLDNEKILMATCAAYLELMKNPTPEIVAYFAFWSVKNDQMNDLAKEVQKFAGQLETAREAQRYKLCTQFIRANKKAASRG